MKPYFSREPDEDISTVVPVSNVYLVGKESGPVPPEEESDPEYLIPSSQERPSNSPIMSNLDEYLSYLTLSQRNDLKTISFAFQVSNDLPGICSDPT